ncbi:TraR/DksA C4-type zinc finger protein [bacterium]|nr:TraR/DksA C4-type zinc finger protein [bacterium]
MKKEKIELFNQISSYASCLGDNWDKVLESALIIHGHLCGAMPLGFRVGRMALKALGVERELNMGKIVLVETGSFHAAGCFTDGVQFATGCTYGKGLIKKLEYGKWAATVVIKENGRAVKVSVKPEAIEAMFASKFMAERKKGIPPAEVNPEFILEPFKKTITRPDEEFLVVSEIFTYNLPPVAKTSFNIEKCEICGEMVAENKLRVKNGKKVCIPCSGYEM